MNERGVSPLIATIFLIAVSVALGSIVMSLGEDYVSQASPDSPTCNELNFQLKNVNYIKSTNSINIAIDNGDIAIDGFIIKLFNQDFSQATAVTIDQVIKPNDVNILSFNVARSDVSNVYEIKVTPISNDNVCNTAAIDLSQSSPKFNLQ